MAGDSAENRKKALKARETLHGFLMNDCGNLDCYIKIPKGEKWLHRDFYKNISDALAERPEVIKHLSCGMMIQAPEPFEFNHQYKGKNFVVQVYRMDREGIFVNVRRIY